LSKDFNLSYSKLNTFHTCPYRYYLQYIEKKKGIAISTFKSGEIYHRVIENFWNSKRYASLSYNFDAEANLLLDEFETVLNKENVKTDKGLTQKIVINFLTHAKEVDSIIQEIAGVEKSFKYKVSENIVVKGKIDFAFIDKNNTLHVVDYKTGKNIPELDNAGIMCNFDDKLQLDMYNLASRLAFPKYNNVKCSLYFLRFGKEIPAINTSFAQVRNYLLSEVSKITNAKEFNKITKWCNYCTFREIC